MELQLEDTGLRASVRLVGEGANERVKFTLEYPREAVYGERVREALAHIISPGREVRQESPP